MSSSSATAPSKSIGCAWSCYEAPLRPDLLLRPSDGDVNALASIVIDHLERNYR